MEKLTLPTLLLLPVGNISIGTITLGWSPLWGGRRWTWRAPNDDDDDNDNDNDDDNDDDDYDDDDDDEDPIEFHPLPPRQLT